MRAQLGQILRQDIRFAALEVRLELINATLGAKQYLLGDRRCLDSARRIPDELAQKLRLRHPGLALHVAGSEPVHGIGDGDQGEGAHLVSDSGQIGGLLRIAAEQHRIAGR